METMIIQVHVILNRPNVVLVAKKVILTKSAVVNPREYQGKLQKVRAFILYCKTHPLLIKFYHFYQSTH